MGDNLVAFEWTCPLCGESKKSLVAQHEGLVEGLAKNAVGSHIRGRNDDIHGTPGKYPVDFDRTDLLQYIELGDVDQTRDVPIP